MADNPITSEIAALKRAKPKNAAEARTRATELARLHGILEDAARKAVDASAQKRLTNGGGSIPISEEYFHEVLVVVRDWAVAGFAKRDASIADLKKEIAELKAKPSIQDAGTWDEQKIFHPGDIISHAGSAWICRTLNSRSRPGKSDAWRLLAKRGNDGKDLR